MVDATDFESKELEVDADIVPVQRYKPVELLGQGSLGLVYLCVDRRLGKVVAVKCLLSITDDRVVSFHNEAKIASRLNHESVIQILDFGITDGGRPFMVMEHFDGRSLQDILRDHSRFSEQEAIELFLLVAEALLYLHENGVFHRDLKPSNILVGQDANGSMAARLIDFNLSKTSQDVQSKTIVQGRTVVGTPAYMSPDQVAGQPYDEKSEVYSMGCLMYEVLTGQPPYSGETALEVLNQHATGTLVSPRKLFGYLSREVSGIVEKCLQKSRDDRYPSMAELIEDLNGAGRLQQGRTMGSTTIFASTKVNPRRKNLASNVFVAIIVAVIVVIGVGGLVLLSRQPPQMPVISHSLKSDSFSVGDITDKIEDQLTSGTSLAKSALATGATKVRLAYTCEDNDLKVFKGNQDVDHIIVNSSLVTDKGIRYLAYVPNLKKLELDYSQVRTLENINSLKKLELLSVCGTKITDSSLAHVKDMNQLFWLRLGHTDISDRGIGNLSGLDSLADLDLSYTKVTDGCFTSLKKFKSLGYVNVNGTAVTYSGLRKFILAMPALRMVAIKEAPPISDKDVARLESESPSINFDPGMTTNLDKMERKASYLLVEKMYREALGMYQKCLDMPGEKNWERLTRIKMAIAKCQTELKDWPAVFKTYDDYIQLSESKGHLTAAQLTCDVATESASRRKNWKKAEDFANRGIKVSIKLAGLDSEPTARHYITMGDVYMVATRYKEAYQPYETSAAILTKLCLNKVDEAKIAMPIARLADCLRYQDKALEAEERFDAALNLLRKHKSSLDEELRRVYCTALLGKTQLLYQENRLEDALKTNDEMYRLTKEIPAVAFDQKLLCLEQRTAVLSLLKRSKESDDVNRMVIKLKKNK